MALAGLDNAALSELTEELQVPALHGVLQLEPRQVNSIAGVGCRISLPEEHAHRTLADVLRVVEQSRMVTKGGFVGDKNSLVECVEYLFTKISTRKRSA